MTILHLSADYPDTILGAKTRAVSMLLALTPEFEHRVYSINRTGWPFGIAAVPFDDAGGQDHRAVVYGAPPKGLFLARFLDRLADWIAEDIARRGLRPGLVHAHKLSVEGLIGERVADRLGVPLIVSVQGNSDVRIVGVKRDLRPRWQRIWRGAAVVHPFAPWAAQQIEALLGPREGPILTLPCPTESDAIARPQLVGPLFRSAFNLRHFRLKNAEGLLKGVAIAARKAPDTQLEIIGGGDVEAFVKLTRLIGRIAPGRVRLLGARPHGEMQALFNGACAFAMPSWRESYGMVFAESLLAGTPCLYSQDRAIDGYFETGSVVLAANPAVPEEVGDALVRLGREEAAFKDRLAALADAGGLAMLQRAAIAARYRDGIARARASAQRDH